MAASLTALDHEHVHAELHHFFCMLERTNCWYALDTGLAKARDHVLVGDSTEAYGGYFPCNDRIDDLRCTGLETMEIYAERPVSEFAHLIDCRAHLTRRQHCR